MSRAFAIKATGSATVMHSLEDFENPPQDGLWGQTELEAIKDGEKVDSIAKVKEDGSEHKVFWQREAQALKPVGSNKNVFYANTRAGVKRRETMLELGFLKPVDYQLFDEIA